jgi:hypothetical protein
MTSPVLAALLLGLAPGGQYSGASPAPPGTVSLSLAEYDRLLDRAAKPPKAVEPPPIASVLARAAIRCRVAGDLARGALTLEGEVYQPGFAKVRLLSGMTLFDGGASGRTVPLVAEGDAQAAVLPQGPFSIALDFGAPLRSEPGRSSFELSAPLAGSVRATIEVPGPGVDVRVEPGLVTRRTTVGSTTVVDATLEPGTLARVSWSARNATRTAPREARFLSDVKTLASIEEATLHLSVLAELNVIQGDPEAFVVQLPHGFEVTGASGTTLDASWDSGVLKLTPRDPSVRRHQALISLEREVADGSFHDEVPLLSVDGAQRETGEVAIEGASALEMTATEAGSVRRMDVREVQAALRLLARAPLLAAFRYHRVAESLPKLSLSVTRFPDAAVLPALAERAVVTTLVTSQGRRLTEVSLTLQNHAQKFVRVKLPAGATIVSAEVGGGAVKPVTADDGVRVPLLRSGFKPSGPYAVSFVYLDGGTRFDRKGQAQVGLPRMDVPVNLLEWEVFLPDRYRVRHFGGNAIPAEAVVARAGGESPIGVVGGIAGQVGGGPSAFPDTPPGRANALVRIEDASGQVLPGAPVTLRGPEERSAVADARGEARFNNIAPGQYRVEVAFGGFQTTGRTFSVSPDENGALTIPLKVGSPQETISVNAESPFADGMKVGTGTTFFNSDLGGPVAKENLWSQVVAPSVNVLNLQRRVAGVLPVHVDVSRAGVSCRFVRPLVLDEETLVTFDYKTK